MTSRIKRTAQGISCVGLSLAAAALLTVATAGPAAADSANTTVTFSVTAGGLSITAPTSASLGAASPGTNLDGDLGTVTVNDLRASGSASWAVTVSSTDFTTGGGTPAETISKSAVDYYTGTITKSGGTGGGATPTYTGGQANAGSALSLATTQTIYSMTGGVGNNTASWSPHLVVHIPANAVNGSYTGTVTHTVT